MSSDPFSENESNITVEACSWIAQLETGKLTAADEEAFREWISRSPRHASEIKNLAVMSKDLNLLSEAYTTDLAENIHRAAVSQKKSRKLFSLEPMVAGSLAIAVIFAFVLMFSQSNGLVEATVYTTAIGEYREFTLSDGSIIELNTDSQVEVSYDKNNRRVRLLSGEAFFDVTPNADRPFWVYAGDKYVRVVGTAFMVSLLDENFELLVTEGKVELMSNTASVVSLQQSESVNALEPIDTEQLSNKPISLIAGQSISIADTEQTAPVQTLSERDQRRELSWQEGLHDFSDNSLEEVINQVARYNQIEIEITDPELRELRFGGVFRIGDTEPLFDALVSAYGVQVSYVDDNHVILSRL